MNTRTHWKKLINPDFIGAYALTDGEDMTVTIDFVQNEEITGTGGKKEVCMVARLVNEKPLILNATNSKSISRLYGPFIEDWRGQDITLHASTTKMGGEIVECLRIRPSVAKRKKPGIADARLDKAIEQIKAGTYTVEKLEASFALTEEQQQRVTEATQEQE
jgi:hypothetical protein